MIIDGKKIAKEIYAEVKGAAASLPRPPKLTAITCAPNFETRSYLDLKKRKATEVGIDLNVIELPDQATTEDVIQSIERVLPECDGVVVQLPLPTHIDRERVLAAVPADQDPDGFSYIESVHSCLPPVVGAIAEIAERNDIEWEGKEVAIIGYGRLVGQPAAEYARRQGADIRVYDVHDDISDLTKFDIVISGVGKPQLITTQLLKAGVVIFDAGTSEDGGELVGDVDSSAAQIATLFTPVPGGIGPITVACLLRNLVTLVRQ